IERCIIGGTPMSEGTIRVVTATPSDRGTFIGGSDARIIMGSDEAALIQLWQEKRGEAEPEDLSGNLVVQLGAATEELNRRGYERNTSIRPSPGWRPHSMALWRMQEQYSRPNSCCPGRSPRRPRPRSTWPRSSTICGSLISARRCCPSSPAAASGSRSRSLWTHYI